MERDNFRVVDCWHWMGRGVCAHGDACGFKHDPEKEGIRGVGGRDQEEDQETDRRERAYSRERDSKKSDKDMNREKERKASKRQKSEEREDRSRRRSPAYEEDSNPKRQKRSTSPRSQRRQTTRRSSSVEKPRKTAKTSSKSSSSSGGSSSSSSSSSGSSSSSKREKTDTTRNNKSINASPAVVCVFFQRGNCLKGTNCPFQHPTNLRSPSRSRGRKSSPKRSRSRSVPRRKHQQSPSPSRDNMFRMQQQQQMQRYDTPAVPPNKAHTVDCRHWARGQCFRGEACNFKHDLDKGTPMEGQGELMFYQQDDRKLYCARCGGEGHFDRNCPQNQCFNCEEYGHKSGTCPHPGPRCRACGDIGHIAVRCPNAGGRVAINSSDRFNANNNNDNDRRSPPPASKKKWSRSSSPERPSKISKDGQPSLPKGSPERPSKSRSSSSSEDKLDLKAVAKAAQESVELRKMFQLLLANKDKVHELAQALGLDSSTKAPSEKSKKSSSSASSSASPPPAENEQEDSSSSNGTKSNDKDKESEVGDDDNEEDDFFFEDEFDTKKKSQEVEKNKKLEEEKEKKKERERKENERKENERKEKEREEKEETEKAQKESEQSTTAELENDEHDAKFQVAEVDPRETQIRENVTDSDIKHPKEDNKHHKARRESTSVLDEEDIDSLSSFSDKEGGSPKNTQNATERTFSPLPRAQEPYSPTSADKKDDEEEEEGEAPKPSSEGDDQGVTNTHPTSRRSPSPSRRSPSPSRRSSSPPPSRRSPSPSRKSLSPSHRSLSPPKPNSSPRSAPQPTPSAINEWNRLQVKKAQEELGEDKEKDAAVVARVLEMYSNSEFADALDRDTMKQKIVNRLNTVRKTKGSKK